jgi:hypothetical protein
VEGRERGRREEIRKREAVGGRKSERKGGGTREEGGRRKGVKEEEGGRGGICDRCDARVLSKKKNATSTWDGFSKPSKFLLTPKLPKKDGLPANFTV